MFSISDPKWILLNGGYTFLCESHVKCRYHLTYLKSLFIQNDQVSHFWLEDFLYSINLIFEKHKCRLYWLHDFYGSKISILEI